MMKTRNLIILGMAIVACMMTSCKKDEETPTNSVVFKASIESRREMGIDKTAIDTTDPQNRGKVVWSVGDRIRIHNGAAQNNNHMFTLTSQPGLVHGDFCFNGEYELTGNYLAAYPTTGEIDFSENKVVFSLPAIQDLGTTDGTFVNGANPMVAKATDINGLQFKNACGGIGIRLKGAVEGVRVSNVRVTSYRTFDCLWGNLTVYMNNDGDIDNMIISNDGETNRNVIDLSCDFALSTTEAKRVFIILPEGTLSQGFTLEVTYKVDGGDNQTFTKLVPLMAGDEVTVVRNMMKSLPVLTIGSSGSGGSDLPNVTTSNENVQVVSPVLARCGGTATGTYITYGISYSTNENFEGLGGVHVRGTNINNGSFTVDLSGLSGNTTYYARAFASYNNGIVYGDRVSFITYALPVVTTSNVSNITATTAISSCSVTSVEEVPITGRGICWSTSPNPTISDASASNGNGTGSYTAEMTGLIGGTTYHVRAYASFNDGIVYGGEVSFTTLPDVPIVPLPL